MQHVITHLAESGPSYDDDPWMVASTPVEHGPNRETAKRSDLAGQTLKAQLDLEPHGSRTKPGVCARTQQRTPAICQLRNRTQQPRPAPSLSA